MMTDTPSVAGVLALIQRLSPTEREHIRQALVRDAEEQERAQQRAKNQDAIALLDGWLAHTEDDDGEESWEQMLEDLDAQRGYRKLFRDDEADSTFSQGV